MKIGFNLKWLLVASTLGTAGIGRAQTQIIAHRGFFKSEPPTTENSIKSLAQAQELGIYGSEFDVRMSQDGILVIHHDEHKGKATIAETSFLTLRTQPLSNGEMLPTLREYLLQGKSKPTTKLIMELKPAATKALEDEIVGKAIATVLDLGLENQVEYISFSQNMCTEVKKRLPNSTVLYLNGDLSPQQIRQLGLDGVDYHYQILLTKQPTWLEEAKKLGLKTNAWTVNDPDIIKQLKERKIDFLTTNHPDRFK